MVESECDKTEETVLYVSIKMAAEQPSLLACGTSPGGGGDEDGASVPMIFSHLVLFVRYRQRCDGGRTVTQTHSFPPHIYKYEKDFF